MIDPMLENLVTEISMLEKSLDRDLREFLHHL
jgi:hypothetical protein